MTALPALDPTLTFEQGPNRPPSEAQSLLLRFTRSCPWNKCKFCPVYKRRTFSRRSLEEIKAGARVVCQGRRRPVHVESAFSLARHYEPVFEGKPLFARRLTASFAVSYSQD